jgi:chromosome partitioning protein
MTATPQIIVIHNGKGGVGKTTTTIGIASILAERQKILVVDTDEQGSCSWWCDRGEMPFDVVREVEAKHLKKLRQASKYETIVVDTPPALRSAQLEAVLEAADFVILPTPCAPMDLIALMNTVRDAIKPTNIPHRVLLTKVDSRCLSEAIDAQNHLISAGVPVCHSFIRSYKAHERAALEGLPINQLRGKNAKEAEADYRRVADELQRDWRS